MELRLFIVVVLAMVMLVGCGGLGKEEASVSEETEPVEETTEEATAEEARKKAAEQGVKAKPSAKLTPKDQENLARGECQLSKAAQDLGPEAFNALQDEFTEKFEVSIDSGSDVQSIQEFLAERGYECTDKEANELIAEQQKEQREAVDKMAQKQAEAQQQSGVNEAGQDISNIPEMSSEERKAEAECLRRYYESLPGEERGKESQRVTREANAQGVTPGEVVGC